MAAIGNNCVKSNREEREQLLREMAAAYRQFRRLERSLNRPPLNRQFKNSRCKSAVRIQADRNDVLEEIESCKCKLLSWYCFLPEVRNDPSLQLTGTALRFAASLVQPQRCPKRMKNQQTFAATMPGAVAGPGAQPEEARIAGSGRDS